MSKTILVVDDKEELRVLLKSYLEQEGFRVVTAVNGRDALFIARQEKPNLIILDLMMPEMGGYDFMRAHSREADTPTIILTAKLEENDKILGLELGADDYVTKPFSPKILLARVKAVLRRKSENPANDVSELVRIHNLVIHSGRREVRVDGEPVDLTFTEFGVLSHLVRRPGWVFTRTQIVDAVRGSDYFVTDRSVDVQIVGLRKKLGSAGKYIETVRGVGYRFKEK